MVALCSALYFKGTWDKPFDEPVDGEFHLDNDNTKKCKLITVKVQYFIFSKYFHQKNIIKINSLFKENFAWGWDDELNVQVVELPYTSDSQMILVVPKYYDGLTELEKKLSAEKLSEMVKNLDRTKEEEVQVRLILLIKVITSKVCQQGITLNLYDQLPNDQLKPLKGYFAQI